MLDFLLLERFSWSNRVDSIKVGFFCFLSLSLVFDLIQKTVEKCCKITPKLLKAIEEIKQRRIFKKI